MWPIGWDPGRTIQEQDLHVSYNALLQLKCFEFDLHLKTLSPLGPTSFWARQRSQPVCWPWWMLRRGTVNLQCAFCASYSVTIWASSSSSRLLPALPSSGPRLFAPWRKSSWLCELNLLVTMEAASQKLWQLLLVRSWRELCKDQVCHSGSPTPLQVCVPRLQSSRDETDTRDKRFFSFSPKKQSLIKS